MNQPTKILPDLIPIDQLEMASECLKTIAHPCRLRMIQMLLADRYTVGELAEACKIQSHIASTHLRLLKHCGLLEPERDGRKTYYRIAEPCLSKIMECIETRFGS